MSRLAGSSVDKLVHRQPRTARCHCTAKSFQAKGPQFFILISLLQSHQLCLNLCYVVTGQANECWNLTCPQSNKTFRHSAMTKLFVASGGLQGVESRKKFLTWSNNLFFLKSQSSDKRGFFGRIGNLNFFMMLESIWKTKGIFRKLTFRAF